MSGQSPDVQRLVKEWRSLASGDLDTARREAEVSERYNPIAVCFHAQQAVEKLMKGVIQSRGAIPDYIHDLVRLNRDVADLCPGWKWPEEPLRLLTTGAVGFRYPGPVPTTEQARACLAAAEAIWPELMRLL